MGNKSNQSEFAQDVRRGNTQFWLAAMMQCLDCWLKKRASRL